MVSVMLSLSVPPFYCIQSVFNSMQLPSFSHHSFLSYIFSLPYFFFLTISKSSSRLSTSSLFLSIFLKLSGMAESYYKAFWTRSSVPDMFMFLMIKSTLYNGSHILLFACLVIFIVSLYNKIYYTIKIIYIVGFRACWIFF